MTTRKRAEGRREESEATEMLALVFADVVEFTAIMSEVGDLAALGAAKEFLSRANQLERSYHGRIIKAMGDTVLAVFDDVAMAMRFSAELLASLRQEPVIVGDRKLAVKISLHLGSVRLLRTSYGEDVFGIDVNVAARLSACAAPSQLVVSEAAFTALPRELQALLEPMDRLTLKGIPEPVQTYRLARIGE